MREDQVNDEVEKALKDIDLVPKGNTQAGKLSGGQKRKLSIGIALIGDPKVFLWIILFYSIVCLQIVYSLVE